MRDFKEEVHGPPRRASRPKRTAMYATDRTLRRLRHYGIAQTR
ncbi:hypothetical protein [Nonomuraea wenchangensis]